MQFVSFGETLTTSIMKKIALTAILCTLFFTVKAQETSVEKSINGVQTGFFGIYGI